MRRDDWQLGTWGRIPVSMHWTVLLSFAWMYLVFFDLTLTLISIPFLFLLFVAHEYGHVRMLRWRKIGVTGVSLYGVHGETSYNEYAAKADDVIAVAWSGVAAQAILMVVTLATYEFIPFAAMPFGSLVAVAMYVVLVKINAFLMIVALLPIGPFDGHAAWRFIPRMRAKMKRARPKARPKPPPEPTVILTPEEQRELDQSSEQEAADLMARLRRKSDAPTQDR